ncbi:MAG: hypothetical protein K0S26_2638 [Bacteroidota bacterium]|jgi:hypothetical protein|nr:hypothetical protein [Bacteroidota bacterium]
MKKESKEMLKQILRNQEVIMKALNIDAPKKEAQKTEEKSMPVKKVAAKNQAKKAATKRK